MITHREFIGKLRLYFSVFCLWIVVIGTASAEELATPEQFIIDTENYANAVSLEMQVIDAYKKHGASSFWGGGGNDAAYSLDVTIPRDGYYRVYAWWPQLRDLSVAPKAKYSFSSMYNQWIVTKNQTESSGQWVLLGEFEFIGTSQIGITVTGNNQAPFAVDAFRFSYAGDSPGITEITTDKLPVAVMDEYYEFRLRTTEATVVGTWGIASPLPAGLKLNVDSGIISGVPTESGTFRLDVFLVSPAGNIAARSLSLVVVASPANKSIEISNSRQTNSTLSSSSVAITSVAATTSLLEEVTNMPEGSWLRVNQNFFSEVWTPSDLRPLNNLSNPTPERIIIAWSSFAWDSNKGDLILYGGGHANYSGNDVYIWRGATRLWERASLPSEIVQDDFGNWRAIDGVFAAPSSAHTYDNNVYLPLSRRFMTYGGAAYNNGGAYKLQVDATTTRGTGPYVFNPALANADQVGGTTGSHVQRVAPFPEITGGNMWMNRDMYGLTPKPPRIPVRFINGTSSVTIEDGQEVIYLSAISGGTAQQLYKHTIVDINDPSKDIWEQVGRFWNTFSDQGAGAYSPESNVYVRTAGSEFIYWSLQSPSPVNNNEKFIPVDSTGTFVPSRNYGLDFFPLSNAFYLWDGGTEVWRLDPPATISPNGWTISGESAATLPAPNGDYATGILGKWEFAADLNAFVGLQDIREGNVWIYKPRGWQPPIPSNQLPTVSITTPINGDSFVIGETVSIAATASDADGSINRVEFYRGSIKIGEDYTTPYSIDWMNVPAGVFTLTAKAYDDQGASNTSIPVNIEVIDNNQPPQAQITSPLDGDNYWEGDTIILAADAFDTDGTVVLVEFFAGQIKLGEASVAPYIYNWVNAQIGTHQLTSKAFDDNGASTTSAVVTVEVVSRDPSVTLTSPVGGESFVAGETITLTADASDTDGSIVSVEFYAGTTILGVDNAAPYSFDWVGAPTGTHQLTAQAFDDGGASTTSAVVIIEVVSSNISPIVTLTSPLDGESFVAGDTIFLTADASDADGSIVRVDFYEGVNKLGEAATAPFTFDWLTVPVGNFSLTAVAVDNEGASTASVAVQVDVINPGGATTLTLQDGMNGYNGTQDTYISVWSINSNFGTRLDLKDQSGRFVNLVRFAIFQSEGGPVPDGAIIDSAVFNLYKFSPYDHQYNLHRILNPWTETSANWNESQNGVAWAQPGAAEAGTDYESVATSSGSVGWSPGWLNLDVTASVQAISFGTKNYGWRLTPVSGNGNLKRFFSREEPTNTDLRPKMTISYSFGGNLPPVAVLTSPNEGNSFLDGDTIFITADASDADGNIVSVEFYTGTTLVGVDNVAPYSFDWVGAPIGTHQLSVKAFDDGGAGVTSATVTIDVISSNINPSVALASPVDGDSFISGDTIVLSADASDIDGNVVRVDFFEGANKLGEAATAPFNFEWLSVPAGNYILTAVAVDNEGASTTSVEVQVDVTNPDGTTTLILQDGISGYSGTKDTYLSVWNTNINYGARSDLKDQSGRFVSLVQFAIFQSEGGPVPDGAIIDSAVLSLYKFNSYDHQYHLHRLLNSWTETSANWSESQSGIAWIEPGAAGIGTDYEAVVASTGSVAWSPGWLDMDVTASVQAMSFGTANYGWRLEAISGNNNIKRFYSREATDDLSLRPQLYITYH